ncbi:Fc receptor-like protein 3 isoform X2 [Octodon degus]|nr:Fc receptor-like protein 3 isoform X2 [Octodon degus]
MTLRCMGFHSRTTGKISWLQGKRYLNEVSESISIKSSGNYQCKTPESSLSDPVHVEFSSGVLILQASHPIYEGDNVTLRCQGKKEEYTKEKTYYKNGEQLHDTYNLDSITIDSVSMFPGTYHCTASVKFWSFDKTRTSNSLKIQVQELFPRPVLIASSSRPIEDGPVTLTCKTQLVLQKPDIQLQFCFFRGDQTLRLGCSSFPELQIPSMKTEDSGSYWCQAETPRIKKWSLRSQIYVQRVPVSNVTLRIQPPEGQLIEGHNLLLTCSVTEGTGLITFSWHRDGTGILGRKTQRFQLAKLQVSKVTEHHAGRYYCSADNNNGPILSKRTQVTVKIPVSSPVLTIRAPRAPAVEGDVVELHCQALRGSLPILYLFYHEDMTLGNSSAPSGGGAFFNLSLTEEHSGKYSCKADNGLGSQSSPKVILNVTVPVSCPVLTLRSPQAQAVVGDIVELYCEAQRGSPPILYRFYHENVTLGSSPAPLGGGASFNLSLNTEHAGNYSCEADNGMGAQRSQVMTLSVTEISRNIAGPATGGVIGGLFGLVLSAALLYHFRTQRNSGEASATAIPSYSPNESQEPPSSRPSTTNTGEPMPYEAQALRDLQPVYSNVNLPRMHWEDKEPTVIYSEVKKIHADGFTKQTSRRESDHADDTGNYENVC